MNHGICPLASAALRSEPRHSAEMTSQLLFGELFRMEELRGEWVLIRSEWDEYPGWVHRSQVTFLEEASYKVLHRARRHHTTHPLTPLKREGHTLYFPGGSTLYDIRSADATPDIGPYLVTPEMENDNLPSRKKVTEHAHGYLHAPYLWGGRTVFGIDCSGFTQVIMKMAGIRIPRDSSDQVMSGESISLISEAFPGDLAFFDNEEGTITHTGILLEDSRIIHASGRVRIDTIDHQGIFDKNRKRYTHNLRTVRRVLAGT